MGFCIQNFGDLQNAVLVNVAILQSRPTEKCAIGLVSLGHVSLVIPELQILVGSPEKFPSPPLIPSQHNRASKDNGANTAVLLHRFTP